jgi:hypothetical protein
MHTLDLLHHCLETGCQAKDVYSRLKMWLEEDIRKLYATRIVLKMQDSIDCQRPRNMGKDQI